MHTGSYGVMSADGSQATGGHEGNTLSWPVWSGPVPPLADGFTVRPDTVPGLETLTKSEPGALLSDALAAGWAPLPADPAP